jgi:hypothetical protein
VIDGGVDVILEAVNASDGNVLVFLPDRAYIRDTEHTLLVCLVCLAHLPCWYWGPLWVGNVVAEH